MINLPSVRHLVLLALGAVLLVSWPARAANPLGLEAKSAYLLEARTGRVLYSHDEARPLPPASLSKIMTFELILEAMEKGILSPDTKVKVSEKAWRLALDRTISRMFIEVGDEVRVEDLLYGLMVSSGNDAALALAEARSGSEASFVALMNQRARELGMRDTVFSDSHGLDPRNQRTTARDMALLARHIMLAHPQYPRYTATREFTYGGIKQRNWNRLLFSDPRVDGLKTGHLAEAGYHLVATAREGDTWLIASILGTANEAKREAETERLLNWGFLNFRTLLVPWKGKAPETLPLYKGDRKAVRLTVSEPVRVTVSRGAEGAVSVEYRGPRYLVAPLSRGSKVGEVVVREGTREIGRFPLVTAEEARRGPFLRRFFDSIRLFFLSLRGSR